jgi:hypothetical protein
MSRKQRSDLVRLTTVDFMFEAEKAKISEEHGMAADEIAQWQIWLAERLSALHGGVETQREWATMAGQTGIYSPRLDVAVGPFATGEQQFGDAYDELIANHGNFAHRLCELGNENVAAHGNDAHFSTFEDISHRNWNARCYMAIEIENKVSRKHLMGGAINAAALGRIGVAIGWTTEKVRAFIKLRSYLLYLSQVGKNTFHPYNLIVVSRDQMMNAIEQFS